MKSDYEKRIVTRAHLECATFKLKSVTKEDIRNTVSDLLFDDLLLCGFQVMSILERTGDKIFDEESFKKAADLVLDDNFTLLNLDSSLKNDQSKE